MAYLALTPKDLAVRVHCHKAFAFAHWDLQHPKDRDCLSAQKFAPPPDDIHNGHPPTF